jgi:hypothetical protein
MRSLIRNHNIGHFYAQITSPGVILFTFKVPALLESNSVWIFVFFRMMRTWEPEPEAELAETKRQRISEWLQQRATVKLEDEEETESTTIKF